MATNAKTCSCGYKCKSRKPSITHVAGPRHEVWMRGGTDEEYKKISTAKYYIFNKINVRDKNHKATYNWQVINDEVATLVRNYRKLAEPYLSGHAWHENFLELLANNCVEIN